MGDTMKMISILIIILMVLSSCTVAQAPGVSELNNDGSEDTIKTYTASPLEIGVGPSCPPYSPEGQVIYESQWTGEYPEIEKYNKAYATATFGMG